VAVVVVPADIAHPPKANRPIHAAKADAIVEQIADAGAGLMGMGWKNTLRRAIWRFWKISRSMANAAQPPDAASTA
jgi:hypothetical protein